MAVCSIPLYMLLIIFYPPYANTFTAVGQSLYAAEKADLYSGGWRVLNVSRSLGIPKSLGYPFDDKLSRVV